MLKHVEALGRNPTTHSGSSHQISRSPETAGWSNLRWSMELEDVGLARAGAPDVEPKLAPRPSRASQSEDTGGHRRLGGVEGQRLERLADIM